MNADVVRYMRLAMRLARRGRGRTSPNPQVGAVLVRRGQIIGQGWHRRAGEPHAEIEALQDAARRGHSPRGATLYVTLEPCCTHGRTLPCTEAILAAGIRRVVAGATDPNPRHAGRGFVLLQRRGVQVTQGVLADECAQLNEAFNHWIIRRTPFVVVKSAMTLDGKIATANGESKWITGEKARAAGMELRRQSDAILVGIKTILADDPSLTWRPVGKLQHSTFSTQRPKLRRVVLDAMARTPLNARVTSDEHPALTTIVVGPRAPKYRVAALARRVNVLIAPLRRTASADSRPALDLNWLLRRLGRENVTRLLVEGGGEANASILLGGMAQRVVFFYAPKVLGGRDARKAVAGSGARDWRETLQLRDITWRKLGKDLMLTARVESRSG